MAKRKQSGTAATKPKAPPPPEPAPTPPAPELNPATDPDATAEERLAALVEQQQAE